MNRLLLWKIEPSVLSKQFFGFGIIRPGCLFFGIKQADMYKLAISHYSRQPSFSKFRPTYPLERGGGTPLSSVVVFILPTGCQSKIATLIIKLVAVNVVYLVFQCRFRLMGDCREEICCRGFFETKSTNLIRIAGRLGRIVWVDPETIEQVEEKQDND